MRIRARVLKSGEDLGFIEIDLEGIRIGDLLKTVSRDIGGEDFRRIMLYEDFTRSVFLSGPEIPLRIPEESLIEDVLDWFGKFYMTFLFNRARLVFIFGEDSHEKAEGLEEVFMGSGNYNGVFITPAPYDEVIEFSMRRKRLSEILDTTRPRTLKLDGKGVEPDTNVLDTLNGTPPYSIKGFREKRPISILEPPAYSSGEVLKKISLWELCSLGSRIVVELEDGEREMECLF